MFEPVEQSAPTAKDSSRVSFPKGFDGGYVSLFEKKSLKATKRGTSEEADKAQESLRAMNDLKLKKAWATANAGMKQIPMNAFMMWMSGSSIQIFSIMITVMMLWNGVTGLVATNKRIDVYAPLSGEKTTGSAKPSFWLFEHESLVQPKLVYIFFQLVQIALGVYKCSSMGLLPTATSDWLWSESIGAVKY